MLLRLAREGRWIVQNLAHAFTLRDVTSPVASYERLGDDLMIGRNEGFVKPDKPLWLNLGYWKEARTYPEAGRAMAIHVGRLAGLDPSREVLDVGFGFGEQDLVWVKEFDVKRIVGIELSPMHVQVGRSRVAQHGLQDRIDLREGSATRIPFPEGSFDCVIALECAFNFETRQDFFGEAFRVLRPGGRLVTADILPSSDPAPPRWLRPWLARWVRHLLIGLTFVPDENLYDRVEYARRLQSVGFTGVHAESDTWVFPGAMKYMRARIGGNRAIDHPIEEVTPRDGNAREGAQLWSLIGLSDYVFAVADKPASSNRARSLPDRSDPPLTLEGTA